PTAPVAPAAAPSSPSYRVSDLRETKWVSGRGTVNVRSGPGTGSPVVGRLGGGDEVSVTGRVEGSEWVRVALADGGSGYVYGSLLGDAKPSAPVVAAPPVPVPVPGNSRNLTTGTVFRDCENALVATSGASVPGGVFCGPEMVVIPPGSFMMGSTTGGSDEQPVHRVNINNRFAVGKYEVTQAEWLSVMGTNPSGFKGDDHPVEKVSWDDAQEFIVKLNALTGEKYRLLTESEWEYVTRAGSITNYFWGDEIGRGNANCNGCGSRWDGIETAPVGRFQANAFGVYDLHGNVSEWVEDCWSTNYYNAPVDGGPSEIRECRDRIVRGGSWYSKPENLRSAYRGGNFISLRYYYYGFRLARNL
ncbi:MAG: SUMF1/EgtB/PvdO family nonheme iron enzyme, partial [Rhodospirillales bacterium]